MLEHVNPVSVAPKRVVVMGAAGFVDEKRSTFMFAP